jgi:hypothetical protein
MTTKATVIKEVCLWEENYSQAQGNSTPPKEKGPRFVASALDKNLCR